MCIETGMIYYGAKEAARALDIKTYNHICSCCKGNRQTAGGYHWRYVSDVGNSIDSKLKAKILEKRPKIVKEETKIKKSQPVTCIETGITYFGMREAQRKTGIHSTSIAQCCKGGKYKTAGGYHWKYAKK